MSGLAVDFGGRSTHVFYQEKDWEIHNNPIRHLRLNPAVSRVVHYCDFPRNFDLRREEYCHVWSSLKGNLMCPSCSALMPESIQTLWTLHNFDVDWGVLHPGAVKDPWLVNR